MSQQKTANFTDLELDDVIAFREKLLANRPNDIKLADNVLLMLDCRVPKVIGTGVYSRCQSALSSKFKITKVNDKHLDTNFLINSINECREIIGQFEINRKVAVQQIFEGTRHKIKEQPVYCGKFLDFFKETQAICGLCYNCYKIQIAPSSLIDLMRLSMILKIIELDRDNTRKCMIELREGINKPYKGYIYCESESEAIHCLEVLRTHLERCGLAHITTGISHGCSEYGMEYPEFKFSDDGSHRSQQQPDEWRRVEEDYFSEPFSEKGQILDFNTQEITLRDVICYETWIKYSEIIGDDTHKLFPVVPTDGKQKGFISRAEKQAPDRQAQLLELLKD
ncbi:MAG: hypothetical protein NXI17_05415 [Alphaproteobacteria bacterium]|nr:hypothetical protein [Alphaproteobacteria bacterium]